jgi:hypothetical protein
VHFKTKEEDCCQKLFSCTMTRLAPHVAAATTETIQNLKYEVLPHPPYNPDPAPCYFHTFGPLKEALCGRQFGSDDEAEEAVHTWIREKAKTFFSSRIRKLVEGYKKCVDPQGDDVEI